MSPLGTTTRRRIRARGALGLMALGVAVTGLLPLCGCVQGLFSGIDYPDQTRPVARIDTRGGVEFGATTSLGILFLGRTATEGPCRVHYFLGPQLITEPGKIEPLGGIYYKADIDLKHETADPLARTLRPDDPLYAFVLDGDDVDRVPVQLAHADGIEGDVLQDPGRPLPAGTGLFVQEDEDSRPQFVGLIAGTMTLDTASGSQHYVVFTGLDRLREALLVPETVPAPSQIKYRPDGIVVRKPLPPSAVEPEAPKSDDTKNDATRPGTQK